MQKAEGRKQKAGLTRLTILHAAFCFLPFRVDDSSRYV